VADADIMFLPCGFFFYLSFFFSSPNLSRRRLDSLKIACFHTWCGLGANLGCTSETCCTGLAENAARKNSPKIRHLGTIEQLCRAISLQLRHVATIGKKFVKQQYLHHTCSQYGVLRPTNCWDRFTSLGHPSKFNRFCVLPSLLQRRRSMEANQTLHDVWPSPGLVHYIYIFGGSSLIALNEFFPRAKFTLPPSLAFSYIGSVTARHSSSGRQPNFAAWYKEWNYVTFAHGATYARLGGHCVGHRPTF